MEKPYSPAPGIHVLPSTSPVPTLGLLPVNAFVFEADEPLIVDTGLIAEQEEFEAALDSVIDVHELRWLWLSHADPDHTGSVRRLLERVSRLKVLTTFACAGRMGLTWPLPLDRIHFLNPGQSMDLGGRVITAVRPPAFDAAESTGFFEERSRTLFSVDCFGGLVPEHAESAFEIDGQALREAQTLWATVDSPWLHMVDRARFHAVLNNLRRLSPTLVLSSHLPAARDMADGLLSRLELVPDAQPFVGPDNQALQEILAMAQAESPEAAPH